MLDPACGTGNFLYVSLELMKRLEGEVLDALAELGGQESARWTRRTEVDPHQFLGLEINPRAAAIAELVLWIGYLQWHFRTKGKRAVRADPARFQNIKVMDAVLTWDGWPTPQVAVEGRQARSAYPNARRPEWPEADYIVGNPPFIGGKDIRANLGDDGYAEALWRVHRSMQRQRRLRDVLVGSRRRYACAKGACEPLRLRDHELHHAGVSAAASWRGIWRRKSRSRS